MLVFLIIADIFSSTKLEAAWKRGENKEEAGGRGEK
jgi:hypothetical protein